MGKDRRSQFHERLSTVGFGPREAIEVILGSIVHDVREQALHNRFEEGEMDGVITFHDAAEHLWLDTMATDPPLAAADLRARLQTLLEQCTGVLGQFHAKLERSLRNAQELEKQS
jgi:hypothetical protein